MAFGDIKPTALNICYNNVNKTTLQIHSSLLVQTLVPCTKQVKVQPLQNQLKVLENTSKKGSLTTVHWHEGCGHGADGKPQKQHDCSNISYLISTCTRLSMWKEDQIAAQQLNNKCLLMKAWGTWKSSTSWSRILWPDKNTY